jgi:hypothetical protein
MTKRKKRGTAAQTLGGMIVGFDYQVFRTTPPPHELVQKGQPVRGVSGQGGSDLEVIFPDADEATGDDGRPSADPEALPDATRPAD